MARPRRSARPACNRARLPGDADGAVPDQAGSCAPALQVGECARRRPMYEVSPNGQRFMAIVVAMPRVCSRVPRDRLDRGAAPTVQRARLRAFGASASRSSADAGGSVQERTGRSGHRNLNTPLIATLSTAHPELHHANSLGYAGNAEGKPRRGLAAAAQAFGGGWMRSHTLHLPMASLANLGPTIEVRTDRPCSSGGFRFAAARIPNLHSPPICAGSRGTTASGGDPAG